MEYLSIDKIKQIELELLIEFDKLCKDNNIYYTLGGGTLLGAIRHKGFIPWDDDIDIMMPRQDYNRLVKLFDSGPIGDLSITNEEKNRYYSPFYKIYNNKTQIMWDEPFPYGIWIDVFPLDNLPSDEKKLKSFFKKTRFMRAMVISMKQSIFLPKNIKDFVKIIMCIFSKPFGYKRICEAADKLAQKYNSQETGYIGCSLWGYGVGERMSKSDYLKVESCKFEGYDFNIPSCWEQYLTGIYGDYMTPPPEDKRVTRHHFKAWYLNE